MSAHVTPPFAIALVGIVVVWFVLIAVLLRQLQRKHPVTYEAMGRPGLFIGNTPASSGAVLRFIAFREHRVLRDAGLSCLCDGMLVFMAAYLVFFAYVTIRFV